MVEVGPCRLVKYAKQSIFNENMKLSFIPPIPMHGAPPPPGVVLRPQNRKQKIVAFVRRILWTHLADFSRSC